MPMRKIYRFLILIFSLSLCGSVSAQTYGNEWINFSQQYYRFSVVQDGVYRISYSTLVASGIPLASIDPRRFQVFARGEEQYVHISGENDGFFNSGDYIEFYAKHNDGWFDTCMYAVSSDQPNADLSLFNDTIYYFFTWNSSITNRRLAPEIDKNFTGYTAENYFWYHSRSNYYSTYYAGETDGYGVTVPEYVNTEGWFNAAFDPFNTYNPGPYTYSIFSYSPYTAGPSAKLELLLVGASDYAGLSPDHHVLMSGAGLSLDTAFNGYMPVRLSFTVSPSLLSTGGTQLVFTLPNDLGSNADRVALSYIDLEYPHSPDLGSASFIAFSAADAVASKAYFNLSNLGSSPTDSAVVFDLTNHRRILTSRSGTSLRFLLPNSGGTKNCFLVTESAVKPVSALRPVNYDASNFAKFVDYSNSQFDDVDYIIVTHKSLLTKANEYAAYREATGYNVVVADVDMLYDQFSYGINKHPMAIRNFSNMALSVFADTIHGLFLMGKGYLAGDSPFNYRYSTTYNSLTLLPSFGNPPSDILFTSGLTDGTLMPAIPTGRLAARVPNDISIYLTKMQDFEYEQNQPYNPADPLAKLWMKKVLHFAGGSSFTEAQYLLNFLNNYADTMMAPYFGADVTTFTKTSSAPIQQNTSDELKDLINNGVAILNFFGHGAGIGFDISIDNPADYSNYKRYPFLIANSCFSGDLYQPSISSSEVFVLIENKGSIGYLGSITKSLAEPLNSYSSELIGRISRRNYNQRIGYIIQQTIKTVQYSGMSNSLREVLLEMTLHGDPVLRLGGFPQPDFIISASDIYFNPTNVTNELDSFEVKIITSNIGMAVSDSVVIELSRTFPDQSTQIFQKFIPSPCFADTIVFTLAVDPINGVGLNTFTATIDAFDAVVESIETNNSATTTLFIISNDVNPVYPYEYAVIPDTFLTLVASTGYAMATTGTYIFQIDTTDSFDSPFLQQSSPIVQSGGIVEWAVPYSMLTLPDSTVYFWRVSSTATNNWRESSFQYITAKRGWGQAHFFQFKKDDFEYVSYNKPARILEFINSVVSISVQTGYYPNIQWSEEWFKIDNILKGQWSCTNYNGDGMKFAVFDTISVAPWINTDPNHDGYGPYDALNCRSYEYYDFDFFTNAEPWFTRMTNFIDTIPDGYYVLAFSHRNHNAENYPEALYQAFESIGSNVIRTLPNNSPYIIFGRKGFPLMADERVGANINSIISAPYLINTNWKDGYIESTIVGPASEWGSLHWRVNSFEAGLWTDTVRLDVIGIKADGSADTVISGLPPVIDSLDILNLSSRIDATVYPYLKLHMRMSDDSLRTPAQIERWQVLYEPIPETAIDPISYYTFFNDTVQEGESVRLAIATRNVGPVDFPDSLMVAYWLIDNDRNIHQLARKKLRLHPVDDVIIDSISFSTTGYAGLNSIWVEFNPVDSTTGLYDQLEQYHFNNIAEIKFVVDKDLINPMLDVTFDGVHILDGDIVSANPNIEILLKDENRYLMLDDTTAFRVYLQRPGATELERIFFMNGSTEKMRFYPASSTQNNTARIEYPAENLTDGKYLLMVQARDKSGNESGSIDYQINFEVINTPAITDVLNWPNPFSTKTHFVFTLTGSVVPEYFKIQIMTVTGKVVREIDKAELGSIHIGRNITEYAWDGRDEFGDQLANGVYLYRVIVKLNGQQMNKIETSAGQFFTKEFGKMMLIR